MNKEYYAHSRAAMYKRRVGLSALAAGLLLTIQAQAQSISINHLWSISPEEGRGYVTAAADIDRGVAYNPHTGKAYIVSRSQNTTPTIGIVEADTGMHWGQLSTEGIVTGSTAGAAALNQIGVADDGSIYAANLTTASGGNAPFRIYRWPAQGQDPIPVYVGNPSGGPSIRFGDAIDVRGSGINTEIIAITGGTAATNLVAIFRPVDETLTRFTNSVVVISGVGLTDMRKTVAFGTNNTFYAKDTGTANMRHCSYNWLEGGVTNGSLIRTISLISQVAGIAVDNTNNLVAGVATANATAPHYLVVYDISSTPPTVLYTNSMPGPFLANNNATAAVDFYGGRIIAVDPKNGAQMVSVIVDTNPVPPSLTSAPGSVTIVNGGYGRISAGASGTKPLYYQWSFEGQAIADATNSTLLLTNITMGAAGNYSLQVSNSAGVTNSAPAVLTVSPAVLSSVASPLWRLGPNSGRTYIASDNNQRGLAYNPANNHVLLVSRSSGNNVYVLDGATGEQLHTLNMTGISQGTFVINMIACSSDGQVFAANLTTAAASTTQPFKIYKWFNDDPTTVPVLVWQGDPGGATIPNQRWGDNFALRGSGLSVEILAGARNTNWVALFYGLDGPQFPANLIHVPDAANGNFGLSVSFGAGDTIWGKSAGAPLIHVAYDLNSGQGTILQTITNYPNMNIVGANGGNWVAGVISETPNNVRLLDVSGSEAVELDTEFFLTDNANDNGTGQVAFGPNSLFVLDSNNGIVALALSPKLNQSVSGTTMTLTWSGNYQLQASPNVNGGWTNVVDAVSGYTVDTTVGSQLFFRLIGN